MTVNEKARFRVLREQTGMSQQYLADLLGVRVLSVKRWESPEFPQMPPDDAWKAVENQRSVQLQQVEFALAKFGSYLKDKSFSGKASLTYWRSAEDFEAAHPGEGSGWQIANATSRMIAHELESRGFSVDFSFGGLRSMS